MKIGAKIRECIQGKGLTQNEVSKALNVTQATVSQWISDKRQPDYDMLILLCKILDTTPNELLGWED